MMRRFFAALLLCLLPCVGSAQIASLVADSISVDADGVLVASGNIEVFFEDTRLSAQRAEYDPTEDKLRLRGPVILTDNDGTIVLAENAEIDQDLEEALLTSARVILNDQLQLAAGSVRRTSERFTELQPVVASSCEVCARQPVPTWEIRASRVVHDLEERQIYFSDAQFRFVGVPIFYLPRLRVPDPTLQRASGFLLPDLRTTNQLGTGIELPYFRRINDFSDVTLIPYLSPNTATLQYRYRHNLPNGILRFQGAVSSDSLEPGELRAFTFGQAAFALPQDYRLTFDVELVSDRAYLLQYDFSDKDRLENRATLARTRRNENTFLSATYFRTLRERDIVFPTALPNRVLEASYERRIPTGVVGGQAWLGFDARFLGRETSDNVDGRDVGRFGARADWYRGWELPRGLLATAEAALSADVYNVRNDTRFATVTDRVTPSLAAELRLPLRKLEKSGAVSLLEPVAQVAWTETYGGEVPNEDSRVVEFDEGNLFALSRFPGVDVYEQGLRANLGLNWNQRRRSGAEIGLTLGRVFRASDLGQFQQGTGLAGNISDWLTAVRFRLNSEWYFVNRALIDDDLTVTINETRLAYARGGNALNATYVRSVAEPEEGRFAPLNEAAFRSSFKINRTWKGRAELRYDFENTRASRALLGLSYENECFGVDLSVSRRYTSSLIIDPTTSYRIRFRLAGFGDEASEARARSACRG